LISDFNLSQHEVAQRMGKSRSHIANLIRLLQLDGELKRLLSDGELSVGHAKVLLSIEDPDNRLSVGRQAVLEGWTVRQIEEELTSGFSRLATPISRKPSSSLLFDNLAQSTARLTGRKVKIKASSRGKGTISFSFSDEADLRGLLAKIEYSTS
ncbi:MAG: ParB/RepB/Spo0J family partition protein, partial [Opitutae bacterium]